MNIDLNVSNICYEILIPTYDRMNINSLNLLNVYPDFVRHYNVSSIDWNNSYLLIHKLVYYFFSYSVVISNPVPCKILCIFFRWKHLKKLYTMFFVIFTICICTLIIIGWKFLISSEQVSVNLYLRRNVFFCVGNYWTVRHDRFNQWTNTSKKNFWRRCFV